MAETIMYPGFINEGDNSTLPTKIVLDYGGLGQIKFLPRTDATYGGWGENITDLPIIRYAEILLINAEAKAELGILTQNDLNATVNLLRSRVEMPEMTINVPIDPALEALYPSVSGALKTSYLKYVANVGWNWHVKVSVTMIQCAGLPAASMKDHSKVFISRGSVYMIVPVTVCLMWHCSNLPMIKWDILMKN